ncbi:MAG: alkyl sulfatase dimerization domain-containing protein [Acidimicrobiales bacterium]|jgi:alkyl sulfatase BDS1-like metallo-beta-lactamase superfamily hydrolase
MATAHPFDLPFDDREDFADADRGFLGALEPGVVTDPSGRVVWDNDAYGFLDADCPDTAHPSLWRQGQLVSRQGLYHVCDGIYQVRGLDLSNMTLVEGDTGVIVIDPLISAETAAAALALYRAHRGERPVTAIIYTHAHVDHFGGVRGVLDGPVPILAPDGFMESAVSENVYAGVAMGRRALFMYGAALDKGPAGQIGCGLGMTTSTGSIGLVAPTVDITHTGQEEVLDGVRIVFQLTPGTECPAEMNFHFPDRRALCMAENATRNLHNLVTLRGAVVRDARVWSAYLDEAVTLFVGDSDVAFASHHWPTWGSERVAEYLSLQRDLYAYLHDQTLRLMNSGLNGAEAAEVLRMPPALDRAWHTHGYYGSVSHNVKAVYQRYLGWFDGNPARLWQHPPVEASLRYVECMGGADAVVAKAQAYADDGDLRFAAELLDRVVFADPAHAMAKDRLAGVYEQLAYGCENGTWRNFYLMGAHELRRGIDANPPTVGSLELLSALTVEQLLDAIAIRIDGPRAWDERLTIDWRFTDLGVTHRATLGNGVLTHRVVGEGAVPADLTLTLEKAQMLGVIMGGSLDGVGQVGDVGVVARLVAVTAAPDPSFPIVTP